MHPTADSDPASPTSAAQQPAGVRERLRAVWADLRRNEGGPAMDRRTLTVLLLTPVLLTVFFYYARPDFFRRNFWDWAEATFGADWSYIGLLPYIYWAAASVVLRVLVPIGIIFLVLRESPREFGFRWPTTWRHLPIYIVLLLGVMPLVLLASGTESFQAKYPFYREAFRGGWYFWGYELCYLVQFWSLEAFFRGFMIFGLRRRFGYYSVIIMMIPYCMIHFNKPITETLGAIIAGFILGVLALRSGSFYLGVVLHFAVAIAMDLLALHQVGALPF